MVRGFAGRVKPRAWRGSGGIELLLGGLRLANVGQKTGMGSAALGVVGAGLLEAELAIDGEAHVGCVVVFLTVVLPPADRAKLQGVGCIESLVSAAGTTIAHFDRRTHTRMDGKSGGWDYGGKQFTVRSS
jgi:hypothetical protein